MKRRTLLKTAAALAVVPAAPALAAITRQPESQEWPIAEGQWVMARVGDYELPGVCSTIDGGCVNVTLLDGTVCPAHRPLDGIFRPASAEEAARYWRHMAPHEAVTVWRDGSFKLWHRQDAEIAANDPDWSRTIIALRGGRGVHCSCGNEIDRNEPMPCCGC